MMFTEHSRGKLIGTAAGLIDQINLLALQLTPDVPEGMLRIGPSTDV
jgi:hypothetical protein